MTQTDWSEAKDLTRTAQMQREDLPDGMWEQIKDAIAEYKAGDREDADKLAYIETLNEIMHEYGYEGIKITQEENV